MIKIQTKTQTQQETLEPLIRQRVSIPIKGDKVEALLEFFSFYNLSDGLEHIAIGLGPWEQVKTPLVRLHSECLTGDVFGSAQCDCGPQLKEAVEKISQQGGFLLYLRQEGRGIGLYNKLDAYSLQRRGYDTFMANRMLGLPDDLRTYQCAAEMLSALGVSSIRLLSNNPDKAHQLQKFGIQVVSCVPTGVFVSKHNQCYLESKVKQTSHKIKLFEDMK